MNFEPNSTRPDQIFAAYHFKTGQYQNLFDLQGNGKGMSSFLQHLYTKLDEESQKPFQIMAGLNLFKKAGKVVPAFDFNSDYEIIKIVRHPIQPKKESVFQNASLCQSQQSQQPVLQVSNRKQPSLRLKDECNPKNALQPDDISYQVIHQFTVPRQTPQELPFFRPQDQMQVESEVISQGVQQRQSQTQQSMSSLIEPTRRLSIKESAQLFLSSRQK